MAPGPGVAGPGPGVLAPSLPPALPVAGAPVERQSVQLLFNRPEGMQVRWDVSDVGQFDSEPLVLPGRKNFPEAGIYRLKLKSKTGDSDFAEIIVGIDATGLRFLQLHDQFEQVTDIVFSDIETNKKLSPEIFRFVPPEGVDVFGG